MNRKNILLLIVLILAIVSIVKIAEFFKTQVFEGDATKFVLEDLNSKYPGADIEIISIQRMTNEQGGNYFEIKTKVTKNQYTPCPERMHIFYNYPTQNFVPRQPEIITANCRVCTDSHSNCILVFPEEAIIASHTFAGTEAVAEYLKSRADARAEITETDGGWTVRWDAPDAAYYYVVELLKNGSIHSVKKIDKQG
jgi:hypothetical protein